MTSTQEDEDNLHLEACAYANKRKEERLVYRREKKLKPLNDDRNNDLWLAHYEGYRAGAKR